MVKAVEFDKPEVRESWINRMLNEYSRESPSKVASSAQLKNLMTLNLFLVEKEDFI